MAKSKTYKAVEAALEEIRPMIQADGGDYELIDIDEKKGVVKLQLVGACENCFMSEVTLKGGIEKLLQEKVKGIKTVEALE